ncbi:nucleoside 2-deoxyribosyltransferase [Variovorax sp. SG517]|uniref:nucleoside 2-deoxyribosyltransferase n=1 Tax=Variovorax sp. SG517 TaxID=2587117 RepID=UPI00159D3DAF|nr:nucleoside 2-deoxyribosyltransferase [Variovorax sp. SG517]NVM91058.1 nucleoside 2-deoxyribosyltransferase [Variovorax sp. SG517]
MTHRPRIYLAGPDVFRRDARQHFAQLKTVCDKLGLEALPPSDGMIPSAVNEAEIAQRIYEINMGLLQQADGVVANLAPFRGVEPDSGTVFEVGVATARGLPVVAYGVPQGSYADRVKASQQTSREDLGPLRDANDLIVEDLGLPLNLMLACSVKFAPSAEEALQAIARAIASKR